MFSRISKAFAIRSIAYTPFITGSKVLPTIQEAIQDIKSGCSIVMGGFGPTGLPQNIINTLSATKANNLHIITSTVGTENYGINPLLKSNLVSKITASEFDNNNTLLEQYNQGKVEIQPVPFGILAEKLRAGGFGIPAFYSRVGFGTNLQKGGIELRKASNASSQILSKPLEVRMIKDTPFVLHDSLIADFSIVRAWKADSKGNCVFRKCSLNYNVDAAMAGKICIVEAEEIVETGTLDGDDVQLSNVFVHRVVKSPINSFPKIEEVCNCHLIGEGETKVKREAILRRAAKEVKSGMYIYMSKGLPRLTSHYFKKGVEPFLFSENGILGIGKGNTCLDGSNCLSSIVKGGAVAKSSDAYALLRSGKLDLIITDATKVSQCGDISQAMSKSVYSSYDITGTTTPMIVMMEQMTGNSPNLVEKVSENVTGVKCVSKLITEMGVYDMKGKRPLLVEIAKNVKVEDVKKACGCEINVAKHLEKME